MNKEIKTNKYKLTLDVAGQVSKSSGDTMLEAIENLEKPKLIKTKGFLTAEFGKLKTARRLNILQIRRLFGKDFVREIQAKRLSLFLR